MTRLTLVSHRIVRGDGQGRVNYEIARHALRSGVRVTLYAAEAAPELLREGARWVPVRPRFTRLDLVKNLEAVARADRALAGDGDGVVLANGFNLTRRHHVNVVHFVHGAWLRSPVHTSRQRGGAYGAYQRLYTRVNACGERHALRRARRVVAVSATVARELADIGVPADKIRVITNGVDPSEFRCAPAGDRSAARRALGLPAGVPLLLFVGDIRTPRKNLDVPLRALAATPGVHLAVAGSRGGSPYPRLARALGVAERVHFLGFRSDVAALLRAVDAFACPSRYEPFSLALLEAMASGVPAITARTVGAADLVAPDAGVVLDDPEDVDGFAHGVRELMGDPARRRAMGARAREIAEAHSWRRMADAYLELCRESASA